MLNFSIKDLENLSGIKAHTIRIWEQRYAFLNPSRSNTNIRYYSHEELKKLLDISLLNKYEFKISEINKMSEEDIQKNIRDLCYEQAQIENIIHQLILNMVKLDMLSFEQCLNEYTSLNGINSTIEDLIYPFLQKTKFLYSKLDSSSDKYQHIVSDILRRKLIAAIELQKISGEKNITVLAFLPEGDHYEVELLYAQLLMKQNNINVIYLGANVPVKDVERISLYKSPGFIYTHINIFIRSFNADKFLINLSKLSGSNKIVITCNDPSFYKKTIPKNIVLKKSVAEMLEFVLVKKMPLAGH